MEFTREPIIETVITPREGCKLVVRSSKGAGQEEYFVDALEVVSFGSSLFFRSQERPKAFLVPTSDYEVLEVREARMVLKNVGVERKIKIAGGREAPKQKEQPAAQPATPPSRDEENKEPRADKRRDRKRNYRRRRGRGGRDLEEGEEHLEEAGEPDLPAPENAEEVSMEDIRVTASIVSSLLPPPPNLISETIQRYKQDDLYKEAFFEPREKVEEPVAEPLIPQEEHAIPAAEEEKPQ